MKRKMFSFISVLSAIVFLTSCGMKENIITTTRIPDYKDSTTINDDRMTRLSPYSTVAIPITQGDPYASIVKDQYEGLAQSVEAEIILSKKFYALYDIDGDGTNELLFSTYYPIWGYPDSPNDPEPEYGNTLDKIFSQQDGGAKEVEYFPTWRWRNYFAEMMGGRDILSNGIIRYYGGSPDYVSFAFFRYSAGNLIFLKALRYYADGSRWLVTDNNGQDAESPITEAEFNRLRAEIEGDAQVVEIDWKPLESYGRE